MNSARTRLEAQGYVGVAERTLADMQAGLRFTPALCAIVVAAGTVFASPLVLALMMVAVPVESGSEA